MKIFTVAIISTIILAIGTKIGFFIQRIYFDIKGISLASLLAIITGMVTIGYPIVAVIVAYIMFLYLLCKLGKVDLMPDAILACLIGSGILIIIVVQNLDKFNVFY